MSVNLAADAVFERRDDFSAGRVILGICREAELHIQGEPNRIALDLHVALLHDVEEADLHFAGEIG